MGVAAPQLVQLGQGQICLGIGSGGDGQGNEYLVAVQTGVLAAQVLNLHLLDGLNGLSGDHVHLIPQPGQLLQRVEQGGGGGAHELGGLAGDDGAVGQLDGGGGLSRLLGPGLSGGHHGAVGGGHPGLLHQQLQLVHALLVPLAPAHVTQGGVVAADDLLTGGGSHHFVVHDAVARHVHAHVGGGLVGALPHDLLEHGPEHGEHLNIPVVVHRGLAVGLEVEVVDHVHIVEVHGGGLIGQVHRVLEGQVPDGEGLKLGIARLHPTAVVVIELGQAGGHFARARAGSRDHHQGPGGLNVVVAAIALVGDDVGNVVGVPGNGIVEVHRDTQVLQAALEGVGGGLPGVLSDDHAAHIQALGAEGVNEAQHVLVVGDAQIAPHLVLLNGGGSDGNDHLYAVPQLQQHTDFAVRGKPRQHPGGVVVVKELAAKLQVQLAAKLGNSLPNVGGLHLQVLLIVKTDFICHPHTSAPGHPEAILPLYTLSLKFYHISHRQTRIFSKNTLHFPHEKWRVFLSNLPLVTVLASDRSGWTATRSRGRSTLPPRPPPPEATARLPSPAPGTQFRPVPQPHH